MKSAVVFFVFSTFLVLATCYDFHGDKYQNQNAGSKLKEIWNATTFDRNSNSWPSAVELAELFIEDMEVSFNTVADDMPTQFVFQTRPKLIHSVGAVAEGTFVVKNSSYTGVLGTGCQNLIIRFSLAAEPDITGPGFTPAVAIKFLRSTKPSGNLFSMYSLLGQPSWNFFKHDLTNHVPDLYSGAPTALQLIRGVFAKASAYPVFIGISDLARFDENGKEFEKPLFPFRTILHPITEIHNKFPDTYPDVDLQQQLAGNLTVGPLYDVYVQDTPDADPTILGTISLTSVPTASLFGDKNLFFEHSKFENDLVYRPDWAEAAQKIMKQQEDATTQFTFPDLPWH